MNARLARDLHPVAWWVWAIGLAAAATLTTNPLLLVPARRRGRRGGAGPALRPAVGAVLPALPVARPGHRGDPGGLPDRLRRRGRRPRAARPADRAAARLGRRCPPPRSAHRARACSPACTTACGWPPSSSASAPPTRWPTPSGCSSPCRPRSTRSARRWSWPSRCSRSWPTAPAGSGRRRRCAGASDGRVGRLRRFLVPVLEDALERSLALAAGMDTRGYGARRRRDPGRAPAQRRAPARLPCAASGCGPTPCSTPPLPRWLATPMLLAGGAVAVVGLVSCGRRVQRTRYRPDPWRRRGVARRALRRRGRRPRSGGSRARPRGRPPRASSRCPTSTWPRWAPYWSGSCRRSPPPAAPCPGPGPGGGRVIELRDVHVSYDDATRARPRRRRPDPRRGRAGARLRAAPGSASRPCSACSPGSCPASAAGTAHR